VEESTTTTSTMTGIAYPYYNFMITSLSPTFLVANLYTSRPFIPRLVNLPTVGLTSTRKASYHSYKYRQPLGRNTDDRRIATT